jgi:hypothetical protein
MSEKAEITIVSQGNAPSSRHNLVLLSSSGRDKIEIFINNMGIHLSYEKTGKTVSIRVMR